MQDSFGNYRYYGLNPNNYVTFNGEDAGWRIIGVFNVDDGTGKIEKRFKLIRTNAIGEYAYDSKGSSVHGSSDWTDSRTMIMLNPPDETSSLIANYNSIYTLTPGLYWNSGSGNCYGGSAQVDSTISCDFSSIGLTTNGKQKIGKAKYYLGGYYETSGLYADDFYNYERTGNSYLGNLTKWTGYVGIIYPSDYAYASDLSVCTQDMYNYNDDTINCTGTNWIFQGNVVSGNSSKVSIWTLSPGLSAGFRVFEVSNTGYVYDGVAFFSDGIRPVVYLKSTVSIVSGTGTLNNPYILSD